MASFSPVASDRSIRGRKSLVVEAVLSTLLACLAAHAASAADEKPITYEDHVAGILKKHCATCHGDGKQEGGLNLLNYAGVVLMPTRMAVSGDGSIVHAGSTAGRLHGRPVK